MASSVHIQLTRYCSEPGHQTASDGARLVAHHACVQFGGFVRHAALPAGVKARTKERMLAMVCLAGAWATHRIDAVGFPSSHLRLVTGAGADPHSSVRTRFKGETRLTDLNQSQSSLDAGQLSTSSDTISHGVENPCDCSLGAGGAWENDSLILVI
ncbi:hypothetical protein GW7_06750 [Heterocephalus glaber]|uniref:Uncharacterized protein n=1 Tax=Heterocephalus glaber TaxID=10181 RepID=G5BUG7_HETGA|nr:hypothetical protein GW7_06750 [Heterocephalus glaber]